METQLVDYVGKKIIECLPESEPIRNENDALDLVAACGEYRTGLLLLNRSNLNEDFFDLSTRLAGNIFLKFNNYWIKAAAIVPEKDQLQGHFKELMVELNRGREFRIFSDRQSAMDWLVAD